MIRTVRGDIAAPGGTVLVHEHLQIDLTSRLPAIVIGSADEGDVIDDLRQASGEHGLRIVVDLSVLGSGRDVAALRRISEAARVAVVCATGFYWDPLPVEVGEASVEELRDRMIGEIEIGIDGSNVRAGVIKIGTDANTPTAAFERVYRAAALAANATGVAIITHTTRADQAEWQMDVLERSGLVRAACRARRRRMRARPRAAAHLVIRHGAQGTSSPARGDELQHRVHALLAALA